MLFLPSRNMSKLFWQRYDSRYSSQHPSQLKSWNSAQFWNEIQKQSVEQSKLGAFVGWDTRTNRLNSWNSAQLWTRFKKQSVEQFETRHNCGWDLRNNGLNSCKLWDEISPRKRQVFRQTNASHCVPIAACQPQSFLDTELVSCTHRAGFHYFKIKLILLYWFYIQPKGTQG